jgi:hypothetical protein
MKNIWKKCYEMKLGEVIEDIYSNTIQSITRVPGGWIYLLGSMQGESSVFVPFSSEFKEEDKELIPDINVMTLKSFVTLNKRIQRIQRQDDFITLSYPKGTNAIVKEIINPHCYVLDFGDGHCFKVDRDSFY